jgi:hypothetical protein
MSANVWVGFKFKAQGSAENLYVSRTFSSNKILDFNKIKWNVKWGSPLNFLMLGGRKVVQNLYNFGTRREF